MKGLTHFISGVAAASFIEPAITGGVEMKSFAMVLAGVGGILPDTLDFKFAQFLETRHLEAEPDPARPDPAAIAEVGRRAVETAWESGGKEIQAQFHSAQLSGDLHRQYFLRFDPATQSLTVRIGPAVTMSQVPVALGDGQEGKTCTVALPHPIRYEYEEESAVDIFNGPSLGFRRTRDGRAVEIAFIPWHRRWSHSLTGGALFAAIVFLFLGPVCAACAGLGWLTHVLEDQLGHMGSNLFYPFTRDRMKGMHLMRSGDAIPNFFFVWLAVALIFFNLNRFHEDPVIDPGFVTGFLPYIFFAFVLPFFAMWLFGKALSGLESRREKALCAGPALDAEAKEEMDENFAG